MNINRLMKDISRVPDIYIRVNCSAGCASERIDSVFNPTKLRQVVPKEGDFRDSVTMLLGRAALLVDRAVSVEDFIAGFTTFVRNPVYRTCVCIARSHRSLSSAKNITQACDMMHYSDEDMYAVSRAISELSEMPSGVVDVNSLDSIEEGKVVPLRERAAQIQALNKPRELETVEEGLASEEAVRRAIGAVTELPNRQKLVQVNVGTKVHYIVVDEDTDILRAPKIYDMVCRDRLHLSINITTDRLERCWKIEQLLSDGSTPQEAADALGINIGIVRSDIRCLRDMGRIPEGRKRRSTSAGGQASEIR